MTMFGQLRGDAPCGTTGTDSQAFRPVLYFGAAVAMAFAITAPAASNPPSPRTTTNAAAKPAQPVELPRWLAGAWTMQDGTAWGDEHWTSPRGGIMIGAARTGKGDALTLWETTRIERKPDGSLSFFAQPRGVPASEFPLVAASPTMVEFANPAHDYPQRIRYWTEDGMLKARVSLFDGTQAFDFAYQRSGSAP